MKFFSLLLLFLTTSISLAQYPVRDIPINLRNKVNAVVRNNETIITLNDFNDMNIMQKEVGTILNKNGLELMKTYLHFDKSTNVKKISLRIFDANGEEIKKYKKRDFTDVSASGNSLYMDYRVMYYNYVPPKYPFTYEFTTEIATSSTAFIPAWTPVAFTQVSVEKASYSILNQNQIPIVFKKNNLDAFNVQISESPREYHFVVENIPYFESEVLSPVLYEFVPTVRVSLEKFQLRNTPGFAKNWKDLGVWQTQALLRGRDEISEATKAQIDQLVSGVKDPKEKTRLIYEFMQNKTRYISVQVGIGGWQPSTALEVDDLSYGDCKGLSNYTMALLKSQGIDSYYTLVNSGKEIFETEDDFVSLRFNHAILAVPFDDELVFLECTSQTTPFNYMGSFTDNRNVLMMTPEGGVIAKTPKYKAGENLQQTQVTAVIDENFRITGTFEQKSKGVLYQNRYHIESDTKDDMEMNYKGLWGHLNNLSLGNVSFENDKRNIVFKEKINFEVDTYVSTAGDRVLVNPNIFNRHDKIYANDKDRKFPLEIERGATYQDEIEIILPKGYTLEAAFDPIEITTIFGTYNASVELSASNTILYKRHLQLLSGTFPPESFNDYASFVRNVTKKDKSKIVLSKI